MEGKGESMLMKNLGPRLKALREAQKISQDAMGDQLGVSLNTVSRWELGKQEMTLSRVEQIADVLGIDSQTLLGTETRGKEALPSPDADPVAILNFMSVWIGHAQGSFAYSRRTAKALEGAVMALKDAVLALSDALDETYEYVEFMNSYLEETGFAAPGLDAIRKGREAIRQAAAAKIAEQRRQHQDEAADEETAAG